MLPERYHRRMASITRADVEHVAHLARLHLDDDEVDRMQEQLSNILDAIETLRDVDTSHVGPTASVIQLENVMRDDEPLNTNLTKDPKTNENLHKDTIQI